MINTLFFQNTLDTPQAFALALLIGILFGFILERAGFGSSRKLAGVFYLRDMTVIKVMFTAVITAMLGLAFLMRSGWMSVDHAYFLPTISVAQIVGGLIFGVGFVVGGWCPGTAAAGLAAGKLDALIFLVGAVIGSIGFNEVFGLIKPLYTAGDIGVRFVYDSLGLSQGAFVVGFTVIGTLCFALCEYLERRADQSTAPEPTFLKAFSLMLIVTAVAFMLLPAPAAPNATTAASIGEAALLAAVEQAEDHMEPEELAERLVAGDASLLVVDTRPASEYAAFHIRGAVNIPLPDLAAALEPYRQGHVIVLYSNGMTHPAQARDSLARQGFAHVYLLTDGLTGFSERCLKPVSLRSTLVDPATAAKIRRWRDFFYGKASVPTAAVTTLAAAPLSPALSPLVETDWLAQNLTRSDLVILDLRAQPDYSTAHIPGSLRLDVESLRGNVGGLGSMLLPADLLARHFGLMGIDPTDTVILLPGVKFHDATLAAMACKRLGHRSYAVLNGGFEAWQAEKRPVDQGLPAVTSCIYPVDTRADRFTVDAQAVMRAVQQKDAVIVDARPVEYYNGQKSDEARAGHIPGALNRPYTEDVVKNDTVTRFKPLADLETAYAALVPSKRSRIIIHCRTGHQASQTFYILNRLLGYEQVYWYDAGWTEWAARPDLPIDASGPGK